MSKIVFLLVCISVLLLLATIVVSFVDVDYKYFRILALSYIGVSVVNVVFVFLAGPDLASYVKYTAWGNLVAALLLIGWTSMKVPAEASKPQPSGGEIDSSEGASSEGEM